MPADVDELGRADRLGRRSAGAEERERLVNDPGRHVSTREWLAEHPRIRQVFIPKNACWLNLQEPWWRMFRRQGLVGQQLASGNDIRRVTVVATAQLNAKAKPWIWGRPPPPKRVYRLKMMYRI
ncbi:hypothetical protein [Actinoplanes subglobosus]|uniref:Transposase n=1 Tax=Actinoplanes subglobosus TaxID=1547892 RepID=A0ABV8J746_9ACTN